MESTLWTALRIMEERKTLLKKMASDNIKKGLTRISTQYLKKSEDLQIHVDRLKAVVFATQNQD
jgi:two-component system chemotaxis response regulator CheB